MTSLSLRVYMRFQFATVCWPYQIAWLGCEGTPAVPSQWRCSLYICSLSCKHVCYSFWTFIFKRAEYGSQSRVAFCLGAYRTSPINSLLVEGNEYTLTERRLKLSLQYAVKLYSTPKKSSFLRHTPSPIKPLGLRIKPHLEVADIDLILISQKSPPSHPPWLFHHPKVQLELSVFKKADTDALTYQSEYLKIRNQYPSSSFMPWLYTDGSTEL